MSQVVDSALNKEEKPEVDLRIPAIESLDGFLRFAEVSFVDEVLRFQAHGNFAGFGNLAASLLITRSFPLSIDGVKYQQLVSKDVKHVTGSSWVTVSARPW